MILLKNRWPWGNHLGGVVKSMIGPKAAKVLFYNY